MGTKQAFCPKDHVYQIACSPCKIYEGTKVKAVSLISFEITFPADVSHLRGRGQQMCRGSALVCFFAWVCFSPEMEHGQCCLCRAVSPVCLILASSFPPPRGDKTPFICCCSPLALSAELFF